MPNLRFAVLGSGWWSKFQIHGWQEVGGVDLVAIYNRTTAKAEKLAEQFRVPKVYGDAEALFKNERLDFVDIIAGNEVHAPLVAMAARYRVPVICQKPMAPEWEDCRKMVQACREAGIPFMIHENMRWQAPLREVKRLMDEGTIGRPYRARVYLIGYSPMEYVEQPFLKGLERLSLMDLGSHVLDTARFLFGEPESLYCQHLRSREDIKGEDVATIVMNMSGVICTVETSNATRTSWNHFPDVLVFVEGTRGSIELTPDYWIKVNTDAGTTERRVDPPLYEWIRADQPHWHASIVACNANLLAQIAGGQKAETDADDNLKTMNLVFKAYESAAMGEVIRL
jgi:D-apiose dehydrogenase